RIEEWTEKRTPMQVMKLLQDKGVPAAAVQHPEDRIEHDPNTEAWGLFPTVEHAEMGRARVDGMAVKLSETPAVIEKGAPTLGQHNSEVYGDILGMSTDTVRELTDEGVI
ncbi:MAG: CoA transferase, partial [Dehalococcoidia bacterium]|nr:CoA transferase [Dehalococcoidia bacterium]